MTYLELINNTLVRLRETKTTQAAYASDPYYLSIGAHVNDAKDRVEDAWDWGALRGTDLVPIFEADGPWFEAPDSKDNHYNLKRILVSEKGNFLGRRGIPDMRARYAGIGAGGTLPVGPPASFSTAERIQIADGGTGNKRYALYPSPDADYTLELDRAKHQAALVAYDDDLFVPSLPVYTLATALASRERGEVGGTPTSELFAIADRHLSDAVAQDTADFVEEMDWFAQDHLSETNWRR